jgi:hypothetical protein
MPTFRRDIPFPSSALKMETVCFSDTLASTDKSTQHQNPEEDHQDLNYLSCESLGLLATLTIFNARFYHINRQEEKGIN